MLIFLGWVYTICFTICFIPQIVKSYKTQKVDDVSLSLFILSLIGDICATIYSLGTIGVDVILLTNYSFGILCSLIMITIYTYVTNKTK
jgi:uncharacterized protein with PQ loop repeat